MEGVNIGRIRRIIRKNEGCRKHVYADSEGHLTCGIGHLVCKKGETPPYGLNLGAAVDMIVIQTWFRHDLDDAYAGARRIAGDVWDSMSAGRREALIDWVFQCGEAGARGFKRCVKGLRSGDWAVVVKEHLDSVGFEQTPGRFMRRAGAFAYGEWE